MGGTPATARRQAAVVKSSRASAAPTTAGVIYNISRHCAHFDGFSRCTLLCGGEGGERPEAARWNCRITFRVMYSSSRLRENCLDCEPASVAWRRESPSQPHGDQGWESWNVLSVPRQGGCFWSYQLGPSLT